MPLVLIHIPKTAGTTLHKILVHQSGRGGVVVRHDADGPIDDALAERLTAGNHRSEATVVGHQSVGLHERVPGTRYVTCLRHPVARLISHYHHAKADPAHYLHDALKQGNWGPADYVESGLSGELSNGMVRMLAGLKDFHHGCVDEGTLERALHHLDTLFDAVLLSDRFDEGVLLLAQEKHWPPPYYIRRKVGKDGGGGTALTAEETHRIEALNTLDMKLYERAALRFGEKAAACADLPERLARFRARNRALGKGIFLLREAAYRAGANMIFG